MHSPGFSLNTKAMTSTLPGPLTTRGKAHPTSIAGSGFFAAATDVQYFSHARAPKINLDRLYKLYDRFAL